MFCRLSIQYPLISIFYPYQFYIKNIDPIGIFIDCIYLIYFHHNPIHFAVVIFNNDKINLIVHHNQFHVCLPVYWCFDWIVLIWFVGYIFPLIWWCMIGWVWIQCANDSDFSYCVFVDDRRCYYVCLVFAGFERTSGCM